MSDSLNDAINVLDAVGRNDLAGAVRLLSDSLVAAIERAIVAERDRDVAVGMRDAGKRRIDLLRTFWMGERDFWKAECTAAKESRDAACHERDAAVEALDRAEAERGDCNYPLHFHGCKCGLDSGKVI